MKITSLVILTLLLPVALSDKPLSTARSDLDLDENVRVKRAGFSLIGGAIQSIQKNAFSASASLAGGSSATSAGSASSSSSSSSSSSHDHHSHSYGHGDDYDDHHHQDTKSFDGWQLKKSILNTLLQAVKAIAGGVTQIKGQLIKGSGYLVTQKGKLISSAGESVSDAGRNIVKSAHLIKPEHNGYGSSGYGSPSLGYSLGSKVGGLKNSLTKSIAGLSASSSGAVTSLSSSSSSSSSGHGHSISTHTHHTNGESYTSVNGPSYSYAIPVGNNYVSYDAKPVEIHDHHYSKVPKVIESYGPPKTVSYIHEPHSTYGAPEYNERFEYFNDFH